MENLLAYLSQVAASSQLSESLRRTDKQQSHGSTLSLSRSRSSTSPFAPGAHRRSHPSLQHLSLAPLTPKYPINPSDYDAYFNPETNQLHSSASLSHIAALPSPGGILTNSPARSRANSRTRGLKRKAKSTVAFKALENEDISLSRPASAALPHGALTSQGFGGTITPTTQKSPMAKSGSEFRLKITTLGPDPNWLVQTGLALTEGSRESKGQSWLVKRASSTSLHTPPAENYQHDNNQGERPTRSPYISGRNTPSRSRRGSRDRRRSRRELAMTPATAMSPSTPRPAGSFAQVTETGTDDPVLSRLITTESHRHGYAGPDWADSQTHAEIAAELESEMAAELEPAELYDEDGQDQEWWREDRYGAVDFDGQWEDEERQDEADVQRAVREGGFGLGKWVDGVVDAFLRLDDNEDEHDPELGIPPVSESVVRSDQLDGAPDTQTEEQIEGKPPAEESSGHISDDAMEPAPANPTSVWQDVAWFSRLVFRTARS